MLISQGRMYENTILDMYEFGIESMKSLQEFVGQKKTIGGKPMMIFQGNSNSNSNSN